MECLRNQFENSHYFFQFCDVSGAKITHFGMEEDKRQPSKLKNLALCILASYFHCECILFICLMNAVYLMRRCQIPSAVLKEILPINEWPEWPLKFDFLALIACTSSLSSHPITIKRFIFHMTETWSFYIFNSDFYHFFPLMFLHLLT